MKILIINPNTSEKMTDKIRVVANAAKGMTAGRRHLPGARTHHHRIIL